ncbi:MFS transporter [Pseudokordiimonas caeni]|uniref:MFS transporter n=1 Tax=Pseudokordiimonas caeni TaxID=2997908 RepID=UPI002811B4CB|nr:MFS transporter [Pseudokordiimonas caeni]
MTHVSAPRPSANATIISALTYGMFFLFAMTTDAVGEIIRIAKVEMALSNTEASAFHWASMIAIAASGLGLGFLADRFGRKPVIILGLGVYLVANASFMLGQSFYLYLSLLFISGLAIGVFKTAALALIGDISHSTEDHTVRMNKVEGFFGVGAIMGPMLVVVLTGQGFSWTHLYGIAATLCALMVIIAALTRYPEKAAPSETPASLSRSLSFLRDRYALGFSLAIALYVACEVAIFVWLPTFLDGFVSDGLAGHFAAYAVMIFFTLRAAGRFLGAYVLQKADWTIVLLVFTSLIFACFALSVLMGREVAVYLLPLSGLFMSVIYPTLNSKGISCFPKADHGAVAGLILFFTALSAAFSPLAMAFVSDSFGAGDMRIGFVLATAFAAALCAGAFWNWQRKPVETALAQANRLQYS